MTQWVRVISAFLVAATSIGSAQTLRMDDRNKTVCEPVLAKPFDAPALDAKLKPDCDSTAFYFGIGRPVDYAAARRCAYVERAHPRPSTADMFYGPGVLSMIYANGQGVAADYTLAMRFTCEEDWAAPAELDARLDILHRDIATGTVHKFDLCETATSGLSEGTCADVETRLKQVDRQQQIQSIADKLPPRAQGPFQALKAAEDAFDDLRSSHEVDLSGTGRAAFELEEQDKLRDQFVINLRRLTAPTFTSPVPLKAADASLNAAYQALRASLPRKELTGEMSSSYGTLGFDGVQKTQRVWLKLRDAWITFATALHGAATPGQVAAVITEQRAHQLKALHLH